MTNLGGAEGVRGLDEVREHVLHERHALVSERLQVPELVQPPPQLRNLVHNGRRRQMGI